MHFRWPRMPASIVTGAMRLILLCSLALLAGLPQPARAISPPPVEAASEMVVSAQHLASEVGADILRRGGNAVDAAVAVGYALAVVHPCCGNIGGGGFMTLRLASGQEAFFNFREKAPAAAHPGMFAGENNTAA